jgi:Tol biopolymer transport system component
MNQNILRIFRITKFYLLYLCILIGSISCNQKVPVCEEINQNAVLDPDYSSVTIPPNIAPMNFRINETGDKYMVRFYNSNGIDFLVSSRDGSINIPGKKWHELLSASISKEFRMDIIVKKSKKWLKFNTITNFVAKDSIDKYLVYRLIDPVFESWNTMGLYQRNLENFKETPLILNRVSDGNCMNCHTFLKNDSKTMMFHMRGEHAGTVIYRNGKLTKINTKTAKTISSGTYAAWHPSGKYIAFSVNNIVQSYHAIPGRAVEVYDTLSNIVLYDLNKNVITSCKALSDPDHLETFPAWSPDGRYLYYCCAIKYAHKSPDYESFMNVHSKIRYDLLRIAFDQETRTFGAVDTVLTVSDTVSSISFPRVSPDGRYLLFCKSEHGNLSIWHPGSDLYLIDLNTGIVSKPDINSNKSESFHSWSSTGRWIVFSSRRDDGLLYTRPYFSYFDTSGKMHKPFVLPQKSTMHYLKIMKSYNLPELVTSKTNLNPRKLERIIKAPATDAVFQDF